MTSVTTSVPQTRPLRTTVPADTYTEIERISKVCNLSVSHATRFVIACGLALLDAEAKRTESNVPGPVVPEVR